MAHRVASDQERTLTVDAVLRLHREIHQLQEVLLVPSLNLFGRELGDLGCNERIPRLGAGPGAGVHPERAVGRNAIQAHAPAAESAGDVLGLPESTLAVAEHVVAGLRAGGSGTLCVGEEIV